MEITLNKTITKKALFVILFFLLVSAFSNCSSASTQNGKKADNRQSENYQPPQTVGKISTSEIKESSGIAASRCNEGILWTHNDSGDGAFVYALKITGELVGTWKVSGAENVDWEDISASKNDKGECFLYIGDIGNNVRSRGVFAVYKVKEPRISDFVKPSSKKNPNITETAEAIRFEYPDLRHDAETLLINPNSGEIYILSKRISDSSGVYKLSADYSNSKTNKLEKVANFKVPAVPNGLLTGGDISPDGKRVIICDYFNAYEIVLPENAADFDEIWQQKPKIVTLGEREQGEAVCYSADGKSIFATSEKKDSPLIKVNRQ